MAHALVLEGLNVTEREQVESRFEPLGHAIRANSDPAYKRATWGLRPEDLEEAKALMGDLTGQR